MMAPWMHARCAACVRLNGVDDKQLWHTSDLDALIYVCGPEAGLQAFIKNKK